MIIFIWRGGGGGGGSGRSERQVLEWRKYSIYRPVANQMNRSRINWTHLTGPLWAGRQRRAATPRAALLRSQPAISWLVSKSIDAGGGGGGEGGSLSSRSSGDSGNSCRLIWLIDGVCTQIRFPSLRSPAADRRPPAPAAPWPRHGRQPRQLGATARTPRTLTQPAEHRPSGQWRPLNLIHFIIDI